MGLAHPGWAGRDSRLRSGLGLFHVASLWSSGWRGSGYVGWRLLMWVTGAHEGKPNYAGSLKAAADTATTNIPLVKPSRVAGPQVTEQRCALHLPGRCGKGAEYNSHTGREWTIGSNDPICQKKSWVWVTSVGDEWFPVLAGWLCFPSQSGRTHIECS